MSVHVDDPTAEMRDRMVDRTKERGWLHDARVEAAFRAIPRHVFLPGVDLEKVYGGEVIPTHFDEQKRPISSSSEVAIMACMAEQLDVRPGHRVLEIGAGTGYNAAVLAFLVGETGSVATIDIDPEIAREAEERVRLTGYGRVQVTAGDGWVGLAEGGPYDRIELTASAADLSPHWIEQLADGGLLLLPLWLSAGGQALVAFRKSGRRLVSATVRAGGFMGLRGPHGVSDPTVSIGGWSIIPGPDGAEVDTVVLTELLSIEPRVLLGPTLDPMKGWERLVALGALLPDAIAVRKDGRPGMALGIFDAGARSLVLVETMSGSILGYRMEYLVYGSDAALARLEAVVAGLPEGISGLEMEAVPADAPDDGSSPAASVFRRRHFRFYVRTARTEATA